MLDSAELQRYARHLTLSGFGVEAQERLKTARILLVGAGGLGSPAALYLAAAGVGTIGVIDDDHVDLSNLQRQVLHGTAAIGRHKLDSAGDRLRDLNPHVVFEPIATRLTSANAREIISRYDLVLDGSDNFPTRYLVNDACVLEGKPLVYGAVYRFEGQLAVFAAPGGPCYRCLFAEPPAPELVPSCVEAGVLGVVPGVIGVLQATEAIKLITGKGNPMIGRLMIVDLLAMRTREIEVQRDPACPVCGDSPTQRDLIDYELFCGAAGAMTTDADIDPVELSAMRSAADPPLVLDVREPWEAELASLPDALLIPLGELPRRIGEIPGNRPIVTLCHHGMRSARAAALLREAGHRNVRNLAGGIDAWAREVDTGTARY